MTFTTKSGAHKAGILGMMLAAGMLLAGGGTEGHAAAASAHKATTSDKISIGDIVNVDLRDVPDHVPAMDLTVKEDGTITLPLLKEPVKAAGLNTGELEQAIWKAYVPAYYRHATVIVRLLGQFYTVRGEVKTPNRFGFASATTVLKAIASAGDFTEFARKRNVRLTHADGRVEVEDCLKALQDPRLDLPVFPGDLIHVPRRKPWQR